MSEKEVECGGNEEVRTLLVLGNPLTRKTSLLKTPTERTRGVIASCRVSPAGSATASPDNRKTDINVTMTRRAGPDAFLNCLIDRCLYYALR